MVLVVVLRKREYKSWRIFSQSQKVISASDILVVRPRYIERFGDAFLNEVNAFVDCCLDDKRTFTSYGQMKYRSGLMEYGSCCNDAR